MDDRFDEQMMRRCIELAKQAEGRTSPNPLVGSVVVDQNKNIIGEGYHMKAGLAHAEVLALNQAGALAKGATLYVNLEPCSHFGRTPPCADKVIESGISRVVIGMQDPNPKVCGAGIAKLKNAGIAVETTNLEADCLELNRAFVKRIKTGLPWLALKMASTLDGRIADRYGKSRWISGAESRNFVQHLRNTYDCVMIGGKTAVLDDPELTVRELPSGRNPHRAVIDPSLQISASSRLCNLATNDSSWTVIFSHGEKIESRNEFPEAVKLIDPNSSKSDKSFIKNALLWLAEQGLNSVLCEGGGRLAAALLDEQLIDEIYWILAPKFFNDSEACPSLNSSIPRNIIDCPELKEISYTQLGKDILVKGKLKPLS